MKRLSNTIFFCVSLLLLGCISSSACFSSNKGDGDASYHTFMINPSTTDPSIKNDDAPHQVMFNPDSKQGKLLLWLTGTGGKPPFGPPELYKTAIELGYRIIALSYVDTPAVAQVCHGNNLEIDSNCAAEFRMKRIYGDNTTPFISDQKQDAILNRFVKLLEYLTTYDKQGHWETYLENGSPKWDLITVAGQSQGGGMAAFIAKKVHVSRIVSFSGGWDWSAKGRIANWYYAPSVTPPNLWYGTYNKAEPTAETIVQTYKAMGIPEEHIVGFDLPVRPGKMAHTEGIWNPAYKSLWMELLGRGN